MQIRHILIASDFSDAARATHVHAAALARVTGARVTVLTVNEALEHEYRSYRWMTEYLGEADRERLRLLDEAKVELGRLELRPTMQVRAGDAAEEICAHAREHRVDLVLMGQRGLRNVKRLLLGRTVRRTLRHLDVPVMVVPPSSDPQAAPPQYKLLLAATDFSAISRVNLRASIDLAITLDARLEVMHVFRVPVMAPHAETLDSWPLSVPEEAREELKSKLVQAVEEVGGLEGARRCRCTVTTGLSVAETITSAARENGAALITVPTRGRRRMREVLFGSTTESVLRLSSVPVLVFPVEHREA
jgi:nucleotide-binding universal stress UspA family protein